MLKDFRSIVDVVAVAAVFTLVGAGATACGSSDSNAEAGCPATVDAGGKDAGCPASVKDAGCPAAKDAGCPAAADAGCPAAKDAGCPAAADAGCPAASAQEPPTGGDAVEAWIKTGAYKSWSCETASHASRNPSPHGFNRICSNDAIASNATGTGSWAKGSAAVKELYDSATATTPIGYAVYRKDDADSAAGANWYWYERNADGVVADGSGGSGAPKSICVGCHSGAGSDADHTPSVGGRDFVYTPVSK